VKFRKSKQKRSELRSLLDMRKVLYDQKWVKTTPNFPVYYMYRKIKEKNGLRYDITIIPPKMLGKEFPKTLGHEHSGCFQELYEVINGEAIFLIQKVEDRQITDVKAIKAKRGEKVIVPKGYGHITINPSKKSLKMGNWVSKRCRNTYSLFKKMRGGCYYYTKLGWIKNKNYKKIPRLKFGKPLKKLPKNLGFLNG